MKLDDNDNRLLHISWENINSGTQAIANNISEAEKPDVIITTQEDVIPAALVCNIIDVPLCIAHLNSRQNGIVIECLPKIDTLIRSGCGDQPPLPTIGIISSLIDDRRNVDELVSYYQNRGHKVKTFCIYSRKVVDKPADYHWATLIKTIKCSFPWEDK